MPGALPGFPQPATTATAIASPAASAVVCAPLGSLDWWASNAWDAAMRWCSPMLAAHAAQRRCQLAGAGTVLAGGRRTLTLVLLAIAALLSLTQHRRLRLLPQIPARAHTTRQRWRHRHPARAAAVDAAPEKTPPIAKVSRLRALAYNRAL